jgi:hypothetical protein
MYPAGVGPSILKHFISSFPSPGGFPWGHHGMNKEAGGKSFKEIVHLLVLCFQYPSS